MTTNQLLVKELKATIKTGMNEQVLNVTIKPLREELPECLHAVVVYGEFMIESVKLTLIYNRRISCYQIFSVEGSIGLYNILDINEALASK